MTSDATARGGWDGLRVLVVSPVPTWPITFGNRNRIVQVTQALRREGARITLLHYPSDEEWRTRLPRTAMQAMAQQWDEVFHCPVTRPLHTTPAEGPDHAIDEWWDPAIGQSLDWLFRTGRYDALLVNYTWLSRALEHAPAGVLRILDTHDRFSGRREMLAAHGLAPEYFHTTEAWERVALDRAHLVWAIKEQEAAFFRTLTTRPVQTLLHMEPPRAAAAPRPMDGVLRLGIVGGRNNINATNIRRFITVADTYLRRTLLPVEFVIAGSVCDLLTELKQPYLRQLGHVESMDELYDQVDAVLAPLAFSTGLKIKVGEALSRGAPLISHAHAFEGYAPTHPFHSCDDYEAMMRAAHRLLRDPTMLTELAEASRCSVAQAAESIEASIRDAGRRAADLPPSVVVFLRFDQVRTGSLLLDHLRDAARYVGFRAPVALHLSGDPAAAEPAALRALTALGRIVVDPASPPIPEEVASTAFEDSEPRRIGAAALLAAPHLIAWFGTLPELPADAAIATKLGIAHAGALSADGFRLSALAGLSDAFPRFMLLEETPSQAAAALAATGRIERVSVPMLWRGEDSRLLAALRTAPPDGPVALLAADATAPALLPVLAQLTGTLGRSVALFTDHMPADPPAWPEAGPLAVRRDAVSIEPMAAVFDPGRWRRHRPAFFVEHRRPASARPAREVAQRAGIAHLRFDDPLAPEAVPIGPALTYRTRGLVSTALVLGVLHRMTPEMVPTEQRDTELSRDAGWARIWSELGSFHES